MIPLTLEIIQSYKFDERIYKPDWDDVAIDVTLPNGLTLTTLTVCCNCVTKSDSLEGLDGFIYIKTKEELDELLIKSYSEIIDDVSQKNPDFNTYDWI